MNFCFVFVGPNAHLFWTQAHLSPSWSPFQGLFLSQGWCLNCSPKFMPNSQPIWALKHRLATAQTDPMTSNIRPLPIEQAEPTAQAGCCLSSRPACAANSPSSRHAYKRPRAWPIPISSRIAASSYTRFLMPTCMDIKLQLLPLQTTFSTFLPSMHMPTWFFAHSPC